MKFFAHEKPLGGSLGQQQQQQQQPPRIHQRRNTLSFIAPVKHSDSSCVCAIDPLTQFQPGVSSKAFGS